jgi:fatty acid-binding protein DegV
LYDRVKEENDLLQKNLGKFERRKIMGVKIVTDSNCSLPVKLLQKYDITVLPMYRVKENGQMVDHFSYLSSNKQVNEQPSVSVGEFMECFNLYDAYYDAIIVITTGDYFTNCYQNAWVASRKFPNVHVLDLRSLACGQSVLILEAAKLAHQGLYPDKIFERLDEAVTYIEARTIS